MRGLAAAMGLVAAPRRVAPRTLFATLAPFGPADPRDTRGSLRPPYPAVAFAAGRRTVPVLRALKRLSPATFTIFLGNPRTQRHGADAIWAPLHDGLSGPAIVTTLTTPHPYRPEILAHRRESPDPRVAALPKPVAGLLIGGASRHHAFGPAEIEALVTAARAIRAQGFSLAATTSRRTPPALVATLRNAFMSGPGTFLWAGEGSNPYASILACADALLVTADSTNMVSEAVATTAPVHVFELAGGHPRLTRLLEGLIAAGRVRRWAGALELWPVQAIDPTPEIAADLTRQYRSFQQARRAGVVEAVADH